MSGIPVMAPHEGAAVRYQLDAMIGALRGFDLPACRADDAPVIKLLASLYEARTAAQEIEDRKPPTPPAVMALADKPKDPAPVAERKGVRLAKR